MAISIQGKLNQIAGLGRAVQTASKSSDTVKAGKLIRLAEGMIAKLPEKEKNDAYRSFALGGQQKIRKDSLAAIRKGPQGALDERSKFRKPAPAKPRKGVSHQGTLNRIAGLSRAIHTANKAGEHTKADKLSRMVSGMIDKLPDALQTEGIAALGNALQAKVNRNVNIAMRDITKIPKGGDIRLWDEKKRRLPWQERKAAPTSAGRIPTPNQFTAPTQAMRTKYATLIGSKVRDGGEIWQVADFNDLGVPYFRKVGASGKVGSKLFTLSMYDRGWAAEAVKATDAVSVRKTGIKAKVTGGPVTDAKLKALRDRWSAKNKAAGARVAAKIAEKKADPKKFENWKWSETQPGWQSHNVPGFGTFAINRNPYTGKFVPIHSPDGPKGRSVLTIKRDGKANSLTAGMYYDTEAEAKAALREYVKSIGANPSSGKRLIAGLGLAAPSMSAYKPEKTADKKKFENWKWQERQMPGTMFANTVLKHHNVAGFGSFGYGTEASGKAFAQFGAEATKGITGVGKALAPGKRVYFNSEAEAKAALREYVKSIGANPATASADASRYSFQRAQAAHAVSYRAATKGGNNPLNLKGKTMPVTALALPAHRKPVSQSPAFKALANKLDDALIAVKKKQAALSSLNKEVGSGALLKTGVLIGGAGLAYFGPMVKGKDGKPYLSRTGRRVVRVGGGLALLIWGRKLHPLAVWAGAGFIACEAIISFAEYSARREDGSKPEFGAGDGADDRSYQEDFSGADNEDYVTVA